MIGQAFADPGIDSVFASTKPKNASSRRVLEKLGMAQTSEEHRGTLALFIAVMSIGVAALGLASVTTTPSSRAQNLILQAALIPAVVISGRYLLKHRRP